MEQFNFQTPENLQETQEHVESTTELIGQELEVLRENVVDLENLDSLEMESIIVDTELIEEAQTLYETVQPYLADLAIEAGSLMRRVGSLVEKPQLPYLQASGVAPVVISFVALLPYLSKGVVRLIDTAEKTLKG